jgi:hypothetical protein
MCVGGHDPTGTSFNDYISLIMPFVDQGKEIHIEDMEVYTNKAKDEIVYMTIKYEVLKHHGAFNEYFEKAYGTKPGFGGSSERKHFFSDEFITSITGYHDGNKITNLTVLYNQGTAFQVGKPSGTPFNLMIPAGKKVVAFAGQITTTMKNLGVYYV